jgi:hypothetical protein
MWDFLLPAITKIAGAWIATDANKSAAKQANKATTQGAQIQADAIREGNVQAQQTLDQIRAEAGPATGYLRRTIAEPGELTPVQRTQLDEARRTVSNQLRGSSFAGSGRTATAIFRGVESDFVNRALDHNRGRADAAAHKMHGSGTAAATSVAGLQANLGRETGAVEGGAVRDVGNTNAAATLATGNLTGQTIGDLTSAIAASQRESRYKDKYGGLYRI